MRLVHLSDLHLGFRAFSRRRKGWNLRERDLAAAFRHAVRKISGLAPDLILITGDLFDSPSPPSTAYLALVRGLDALRSRLPEVPVLVIAGERDTPSNPADPGPVAVLDALEGVEAAAGAPRAVHLRDAEVHALLVPHRAVLQAPFPEIRPDPEARWNVLLVRGDPATDGPGARLDLGEWSYVALGGSHLAGKVGSRAWCAGSLERVGWNPWGEATEEKGFVVFDLEDGRGELHSVPGRPVVDLAPVRASSGDVEPGSRRLRDVLEGVPGGIAGKILRIRIRGDLLTPEEGIAPGLVAGIRSRAAHVELRLLEEALGEPPTELREEETLFLGLELEPDGEGASYHPLKDGITVLTAGDREARRLLGAALRASAASGWEGGGRSWSDPGGGWGALRLRLRAGAAEAGGSDPLALLAWSGDPDPEKLFQDGVRLLKGREMAVGDPPAEAGPDTPEGENAGDPRELRTSELELGELRADAVEAAGEMEAGNLEWARERQDAESRLHAYRERARELRDRIREIGEKGEEAPCPTCGRPLGDHLPELLGALQEEWEAVVQDGQWWKRRRAQMEEKPKELRSLEGRALELQARLESLAERVERERERSRWAPATGERIPGREGSSGSGSVGEGGPDPVGRRLLRRAGTVLHRITEGRIYGLLRDGAGFQVADRTGRHRRPTDEERGPLGVSLHLALWALAREQGRAPRGILLAELYGEDPEVSRRALDLVGAVLPRDMPVLMVAPPGAVDGIPEAVRTHLELLEGPGGRPRLRERSAGRPRLILG